MRAAYTHAELIYVLPSICKNLYLDCLTSGGEDPGKLCIFPWFYPSNGVNYTGCANPHNDPRGAWCPTEVNEDGEFGTNSSGKWGYCSNNCPIHQGEF